jgi:hypothetical protein
MLKARLAVTSVILAVSLMIVIPALAAPIPQFSYGGITVSTCTPGQPVSTLASYDVGAGETLFVQFMLNNQRTGTADGIGSLTVIGPVSGQLDFPFNTVPLGTQPDDILIQNAQISLNGVLVETINYTFDCTTGQPPVVWQPRMSPLPDEIAAPYLAIAAGGGRLPCSVFDVGGHGAKLVLMSDFPACTAAGYDATELTVYCLNDHAHWTNLEVSDVSAKPDGTELWFTSNQHGLCGLFPAP